MEKGYSSVETEDQAVEDFAQNAAIDKPLQETDAQPAAIGDQKREIGAQLRGKLSQDVEIQAQIKEIFTQVEEKVIKSRKNLHKRT